MGKRILITDDAAFMRMTLKQLFVENGYTICGEAATGKEAVEKYKSLKPDLVTLDITMPEMNGVEALKQIHEYDPDAKIVICSAMGQQAMVVDAIQSGASDFIVKPFQNSRILATIKRVLGE